MPAIDVTAEIQIAAEPTDVASVMFDPKREPEWMTAVTRVDVIDPALQKGARVRRTGNFLGKEIAWTTAVDPSDSLTRSRGSAFAKPAASLTASLADRGVYL